MGRSWKPDLKEPEPARLYIACLFNQADGFSKVRKIVEAEFETIDYEANAQPDMPPDSLYSDESRNLIRILSFERPVGRHELVDIRKRTLQIESRFKKDGYPVVELDPGYVTGNTVVRTALNDDQHRIYLYGGIYAETLYFYEKLSYRPWLYTPESYKSAGMIAIFNDLRLIHAT